MNSVLSCGVCPSLGQSNAKNEMAYIQAVASLVEEKSEFDDPTGAMQGSAMNDTKQVIIFGATGSIGTKLAEILSVEHPGWSILAATRDVSKESALTQMDLPNVELIQVDVFSKENVVDACKSCDIIFCCIGLHKYQRKYWAKYWPVVVDNLLAAAGSTHKLVICDNLYAYGPGMKISPDTKLIPASLKSKPGIRAELRRMIQEHMDRYPGTVTVIGASDFFGPQVTDKFILGNSFIGKIIKNETPMAWGSCSALHDFCYAPDLARALATAAVQERAFDRFWVCPHSVHGKTMQAIANDVAGKCDRSAPIKVKVIGKLVCRMLSPFSRSAAEMVELMPFWTNNYTVDDSQFIKEFGLKATNYDEALQETVDFFEQNEKYSI